ncbi:MAG: zf-TFIIB domain-containing protein [Dermatophilaceae bacterium]
MTRPPPLPGSAPQARGMVCPKCRGTMHTHDRNGVHIEQCESCRGIFLDYGEFEHLSQLESRFLASPPPDRYGGPMWGRRHGKHYRKKGFSGLFYSS